MGGTEPVLKMLKGFKHLGINIMGLQAILRANPFSKNLSVKPSVLLVYEFYLKVLSVNVGVREYTSTKTLSSTYWNADQSTTFKQITP